MSATMLLEEAKVGGLAFERVRAERDAALKLLFMVVNAAATMKTAFERRIAELEHQLEELRRQVHGQKSEKLKRPQLEAPAAENASSGQGDPSAEKKAKKKGHGWRKVPKEAPREEVPLDPDEKDLVCDLCGAKRTKIGSCEVTERWNYRPRSAFIEEIIRERYRCPNCQDGTVIAPLPPAPLGKKRGRSRAEAGILAQIVVSKFADHLPLDRQAAIFRRSGVCISTSTLGEWVHGTAELLGPIAKSVLDSILTRYVVGFDETGLRIIFRTKERKGRKQPGRVWVYRGLEGEVYFKISMTKAKADKNGPMTVLAKYEGRLQADAAGAFDGLYKNKKRIEVGCRCHERRGYFKAKKSSPKEAAHALSVFKKIYEIEERVRDAGPEERLAARLKETKPIVDEFDAWVDALAASRKLVPGTPLAKAIGYSRNHRVALRRFLDDPALSPDNNAVERAIRLVAIGRRNWLFAGSEVGADDAAILFTLVAGCRELELDPWEYFHDVIKRRAAGEPVENLTPRAWSETRRKKST